MAKTSLTKLGAWFAITVTAIPAASTDKLFGLKLQFFQRKAKYIPLSPYSPYYKVNENMPNGRGSNI